MKNEMEKFLAREKKSTNKKSGTEQGEIKEQKYEIFNFQACTLKANDKLIYA